MSLPSALAPLRHRAFLMLSAGSLMTFFGTHIQGVGAAWEMMLLSNSATLVTLVQTASSLALLIFGLLGGALADMFDRRHILVTAQGIMLTAAGVMVAVQSLGAMRPWLLLGLTFLLNIGTALRMPVQSALANDIVDTAEVPAAVALTGIGANIGRSVGPGIGGLLVAAAGAQAAFLGNMCCIFAAIGSTMTWRAPPAAGSRHTHIGRAIMEGLAYSAAAGPIRLLQIRLFCWVFCAVGLWGLLPLIAKHALGGGPLTLGALLACQGIGAIAGAGSLSSWYRAALIERSMRTATVVFVAVMLVAATGHRFMAMAPFLVAGGTAWITFMTVPSATIQMLAPANIRGRVVAVNYMVLYSGLGLGSWLWGAVADFAGLRVSLTVAAVLLLANLALALAMPYRPAEPASGEPDQLRADGAIFDE